MSDDDVSIYLLDMYNDIDGELEWMYLMCICMNVLTCIWNKDGDVVGYLCVYMCYMYMYVWWIIWL